MTTTVDAVINRIIRIVRELVPLQLAGDRYLEAAVDAAAKFRDLMVANVPAAFRLFQVRDTGEDTDDVLTAGDVEFRASIIELLVAYPQNLRAGDVAGDGGSDDRAKLIDADRKQLELAVGWGGRGNFVPPHPEAVCELCEPTVEQLNGVDVLVVRLVYRFWRSMT